MHDNRLTLSGDIESTYSSYSSSLENGKSGIDTTVARFAFEESRVSRSSGLVVFVLLMFVVATVRSFCAFANSCFFC